MSLCKMFHSFIVIFLGHFCPRGKGAMRLSRCEAPTRETRSDHNTGHYVPYVNVRTFERRTRHDDKIFITSSICNLNSQTCESTQNGCLIAIT